MKEQFDQINEQLRQIKELTEEVGLGIACLSTDYEMDNYQQKERVKELEQQDSEEINPFAFKFRFVEQKYVDCCNCDFNGVFCERNSRKYFHCSPDVRKDGKNGYFEKIQLKN